MLFESSEQAIWASVISLAHIEPHLRHVTLNNRFVLVG